jgi:ComF family protein
MNPVEELLNLLLPTPCCGCKRLGAILCQGCHDALIGAPRLVVRENLAGWAFCDFGDQVSTILNAFKEDGQTRVAAILASKMAPLLANYQLPELGATAVVLVSVPSRASSFVKRGFVPAQVLAKQLAKQSGLRSVAALKFFRPVDDQAGLGVSERRTNLVESMHAKFSLRGYRVLIIDDIVTTGSTILEARRALEKAGAQVIGFLAFAETMLKTPTRKEF